MLSPIVHSAHGCECVTKKAHASVFAYISSCCYMSQLMIHSMATASCVYVINCSEPVERTEWRVSWSWDYEFFTGVLSHFFYIWYCLLLSALARKVGSTVWFTEFNTANTPSSCRIQESKIGPFYFLGCTRTRLPVTYLQILLSVFLVFQYTQFDCAHWFCVLILQVLWSWLFWFGCQYWCNWLTIKTWLQDNKQTNSVNNP